MSCLNSDPANWRSYHPILQQMWRNQITAYKPQEVTAKDEIPLSDQTTQSGCRQDWGYDNPIMNAGPEIPASETRDSVSKTPNPVLETRISEMTVTSRPIVRETWNSSSKHN